MDATSEKLIDAIEACRTCGVFYLTTSNCLRELFTTPVDDPEMMLIRMELTAWKVEINENDGFSQYICTSCMHEFQRVFKFRRSCIDTQQQLHQLYNLRHDNLLQIKKEKPDPDERAIEENVCDFIYVDDLSDTEYDGTTPFNIPHVPIKEESIEEAKIPNETPNTAIDAEICKLEICSETDESQPKQTDMFSTAQQDSQLQCGNSELQCKLCLHQTSSYEKLRLHMQLIHEIINMECHICGKTFKNTTDKRLKFHLKWHKLSRHIKCAQCGFYCSSRDTLNEHIRAKHAKIACNICGKVLHSKKMKAHMRQHDLKADFECAYCQKVYSTEEERVQHVWEAHAEGHENTLLTANDAASIVGQQSHQLTLDSNVQEAEEAEQLANKEDSNIISYNNNSTTHSDEQYIDFDENSLTARIYGSANLTANSDTELTASEMEESGTDAEASSSQNELHQFVCAQCTRTFATIEQLRTHFEQHLKRPAFNCHLCGKNFDLKFSLNRHLKKHKKAPF